MEFLRRERVVLERYLPGLDEQLEARPLMDLERPENDGIRLFREAGGAGLLIPRDYSGRGASAVEAICIQRAIGSRSPSLAIASTMHHFSVATLVEMAAQGEGLEGVLLQAVAEQGLLIASGFSEGQAGQSILAPTMEAKPVDGGLLVSGSKKPCSLAWSMDLLTASVTVPGPSPDQRELIVVLVPAAAEGIERRRFWENWILAGAESDEVVLRDVFVPERLIFHAGTVEALHPVQISGFLWFELLITASYLGIASGLVERIFKGNRGEPVDRLTLGMELESAMSALEGVAHAMMTGEVGDDQLARMLLVRYATERAMERAAARAAELAGGMSFIKSSGVSYLTSAARGLSHHPPSRTSMARIMTEYLTGSSLKML